MTARARPTATPERRESTPDDRLLTLEQVKKRLQLSHETVYRLMRQGKLKSTKVGRSRRFKESQVNAYIHALPDLMRKRPAKH